jgi:hypothetical protein
MKRKKQLRNLGVYMRTILKRNFKEMEYDDIDRINLADNSVQWLDNVSQDNEPSGIMFRWWGVS